MIERKDLFSIPFYKKTHFTGSCRGMRYRIERAERPAGGGGAGGDADSGEKNENPGLSEKAGDPGQQNIPVLKATVFPGPYCFDAVPEEEKTSEEFEFSEEGIEKACAWLNAQYEAAPEKWAKGQL